MVSRRTALVIVVVLALAAVAAVVALRRPTPRGVVEAAAEGASGSEYLRFVEPIMAAPIEVLVPAKDGRAAAEVVFDVFRGVDERMSEWKESSPLSAVNRAAGRSAAPVPDDLRSVLRRAIEIGELTDGAFDVTWAALWGLWDFKAASPAPPADEEIARRLPRVDFRAVEIDDEQGTVGLPREGMVLGLGGIAKGHALDRAAAALRGRGTESFLLSAAGQMMTGGTRGGRPWRVGIRDPRGGPADWFARLEVSDVSVSTSGDYERFFVLDGVRYHHILDPRTGRPARGVRSATVVSADATLADALSTALVILGVERAMSLVESLDGVEAVLVDGDAEVHVSTGLRDRLEIVHPPAP